MRVRLFIILAMVSTWTTLGDGQVPKMWDDAMATL